ncbi:HAMP domain-containing sensor histidine kinase [Clostridium sp. DL1XJH146]
MNSIKRKLFFQIGTLIIILITLLLLANTLLLESYYTYNQKNLLIDHYSTINSIEKDDYDNNLVELLSIESNSNIDILITDKLGKTIYSSRNYLPDRKDDGLEQITPPPGKKPVLDIFRTENINDSISIFWANDLLLKEKNLTLSGTLDNGNFIELTTPLASIKTNIKLSNNFLLIIGIIVFIIAMIFAYIISIDFTKPISEINEVTRNLKKLDFKTSCKVLSNDEIGELAESINEMSKELSTTIDSLNAKNLQLENEIKEKNKLDQKRRTLLNNVSHELKTPISLMQGYAEGLKLNVIKSKEKTNFYCDVIIDESIKMNYLVENLLNIDQMEFGDKVLNKTSFEINDFIGKVLDKYLKIFKDKNIRYKIEKIHPTDVFGDIFMLETVFTNYITNAINYVDENRKIKVNLRTLSNTIRIEVFNTCPPISQENLEKIWDSFYKLDKARTREKGGHGLGLSIVKAILEAHNNAYGVKNVKDGICFWFEIAIDNAKDLQN